METLIAANSISQSGGAKQHQPLWMLTDAANIIFQSAKRRCYLMTSVTKKVTSPVVDLTEDDEAWAALDEVQGRPMDKDGGDDGNKMDDRPKWVPDGLEPVLEELPKWNLLSEILLEAEGEIIKQENQKERGSIRE
jgi:DNA excision repair protein ERCC-4